MKIKGRISILINFNGTTIELKDEVANTVFAKITLTPEQLSSALSRIALTECEIEVNNLERIGKKHENKSFSFEIPKTLRSSSNFKKLTEIAQSKLSDGWIATGMFSSQDSFYESEGIQYARCTIRRWT